MARVTGKKFKNLIRLIRHYNHRYRRLIRLITGLAVFSALANAAVPYLSGALIDAIIEPEPVAIGAYTILLPWVILVVWLVIQLAVTVTDWFIKIKSAEVGAGVFFDYFTRGFSHILYLPMSFHKKEKSGSVARKIDMAGSKLERFYGEIIFDLLPQFMSIIVALVLVFWIQPLFAAILIVSILVYLLVMYRQARPLAGLQRKLFKSFSAAFGRAFDAMMNALQVKQATAEEYERQRYSRMFQYANRNLWVRMLQSWAHLSFAQQIIVALTQAGIFGLSIIFVADGSLTVGELVAVNAYIALAFNPFVRLGQQWQHIQNGIIDVSEAERILAIKPEPYRPPVDRSLPSVRGEVVFDKVTFGYTADRPVLREVSFSASPGETVALVGESGVGKSTLVEMISGYYFPRRGRVSVDGVTVRRWDLKTLRQQIAVVSQDIVLFNDTITRNIAYGNRRATLEDIKQAAQMAQLEREIENFPKKWKQRVGQRGIQLSGGQRQRVAIARAILRDPAILILDEPTSELDAATEKRLEASLEELMQGRTTFIIAHRLSTVRRADKILVLKDGQIVESGCHEDLINRPDGEYRRLYQLQFGSDSYDDSLVDEKKEHIPDS